MIVLDTPDGPLTLELRDPIAADRPYIAASMLSAARWHCRYTHGRGWTEEADRLMSLWDGPNAAPVRVVAHLPEDPGLVVAYLIGDASAPLLHFLNVRPSFRGNGIATALMHQALGVGPGDRCGVTVITNDLIRPEATDRFPIGLLNNERWRLVRVETR